jgi:SCY1-like protein 2
MKDTNLLPYILPNVFAIAADLSSAQFGSLVLPSLKPLFVIKEPPQNMLTLLDNLELLQDKTDKAAFRERMHMIPVSSRDPKLTSVTDVLPLVYNALESDHGVVGFATICP